MKINIKRKLPPGTLMYTGSHDTETKITHIMYNKKEVIEKEDIGVIQDEYVDWIVIEGLKNIDVIRDICLGFSVDHLVIEDILLIFDFLILKI